jgi:ribosomal-protein-alanine N-acetyltransferase
MEFHLRPWETNDVESMVKYASNPHIFQFMSDGFPNPFTVEKAKTFIEFANSGTNKLYRAIVVNGQAVGGIGISQQSDIKRKNAELGYWLGEPFWGNGIISRAIPQIVEMAFSTFDI